jgi:dolichol-phosphate mannosyltransferase
MIDHKKVAVVIPCYKVKNQILKVLNDIGAEIDFIILVDDACTEGTAIFVKENYNDNRLQIIEHKDNQGVGSAVISGYKLALELKADIVVKLDGDGQMNPKLISNLVEPIVSGMADYTKGNRFYSLNDSDSMPIERKFGNLALSFISKFSSGYMSIFDPTNGFTAIHSEILKLLPLDKISRRYFFESDMLFHLGCLRAVVIDVPMTAVYANEKSNLKISSVAPEFAWKNIKNLWHRIILNYFFRDFNIGSIQLALSIPLISWSLLFGSYAWLKHIAMNQYASAGTVMLAALPLILGLQLFLGFLSYDLYNTPKITLHKLLKK